MMETIAAKQRVRITITPDRMDRIDHFIAYDSGTREGRRAIRRTASPEFEVMIGEEMYVATIVATKMPDETSWNIPPGTPVAIADINIDDEIWSLLIYTANDCSTRLHVSDILVQYEGEPEDLLERPDLFEPSE